MAIETKAVCGREAIAGLRDSWRALMRTSGCDCPFVSHAWFMHCASFFHGKDTPVVFAAFEGGELVGVLPLIEAKSVFNELTVAAPIVTGAYDAAVAASLDAAVVVDALLDEVRRYSADLVVWSNVVRASTLGRALERRGGHVVSESEDWSFRAPSTWEDYVALAPKTARSTVRRVASGATGFNWLRPNTREEALHMVRAAGDLCASLWNERGSLCGWNLTPGFYEEVVGDLFDENLFAGSVLVDGEGRCVSGEFAIQASGHVHAIFSGFDRSVARLSPGHVHRHEVLRALMSEAPAGSYHFGGGREPYKRECGATAIQMATIVTVQSAKGWLALGRARAFMGLVSSVERWSEWLWWRQRGASESSAKRSLQRGLSRIISVTLRADRDAKNADAAPLVSMVVPRLEPNERRRTAPPAASSPCVADAAREAKRSTQSRARRRQEGSSER